MSALLEKVLARLGFGSRPEPSLENLCALYAAWCRSVPFDNVRKLIHVRSGNPGPLPGSTAEDYFEAWLRHSTGGTCWAGAGALHALLTSLGFDAERGIGTMLVYPNLPPNHGTVRVSFGGERYLVDQSILCGEPLRLDEQQETRVEHPAWGVHCARREGRWHIRWRPLHKPEGIDCRLERFGATAEEYSDLHEQTRAWSPFNYEVSARVNRGNEVIGVAFGRSITHHGDGSVTDLPVSHEERKRRLIEDIGMSEEIISRLPRDVPTPPPPGSGTSFMREMR